MYKKAIPFLISILSLASPSAYPQDKQQDAIKCQWNGVKVAFLGDSITDSVHVGTIKCYWEYLAEMIGIVPQVYAKNGNQWDGIYKQAGQLKNNGSQTSAIIIFAGTNDYNAGIPLGEWFTTQDMETTVKGGVKEIRRKRILQMDESTFKGRINKAMDFLKTNFPEQQIILLTPIHRAQACFSNENHQPEEAFPNKLGLYVDAYVNTIKEAGNIWAVPVIDLNSICGLYPLNDAHAIYFHKADTDRLHPNAKGHLRMAKTLMYQLMAYPAKF